MAERWVLVQVKKIYRPMECETNWYRTAGMLDFICPTFQKSEIFKQIGFGTCDMGPYKWLYRHLYMSRHFNSTVSKGGESKWLKFCSKANMKMFYTKMTTSNLCQHGDLP